MDALPSHGGLSRIADLQKAAFSYFIEHTDPRNGLVADTSMPGAPCSIAVTGFALSCYPVAVERGWITRREAVALALATLRFFAAANQGDEPGATGHRGFFYHFLDMRTGTRTWNCELSIIDTAILIAGMLTASRYFDGASPQEREIRDLAALIHCRVEWPFMVNRKGYVRLGWKPETGFLRYVWKGYSEALLLFVLGLGSPTYPLPPNTYRAWTESCAWAEYEGTGFLYAGPLFIHLFPQAWLDCRGIGDALCEEYGIDYFQNTQRAISVQRDYAAANPHGFTGYEGNMWGLTACDGPGGRHRLGNGRRARIAGYRARGAPYGPDDGTLSPCASLASLPFAPEASFAGVSHIATHYPELLDQDCFPESFNPGIRIRGNPHGWVSPRLSGLDQGLLVMNIENFRSGLVWSLTRESPLIRNGLAAAGFRGGWLEGGQKRG